MHFKNLQLLLKKEPKRFLLVGEGKVLRLGLDLGVGIELTSCGLRQRD